MEGIDLDQPIRYKNSSFRYFAGKEHHVTRLCNDNVLLLVVEGCLRFFEDGKPYEIFPGQYFIQKQGGYQTGELASDGPKYLYVHFMAQWGEGNTVLQRTGSFPVEDLMPLMQEMDKTCHRGYTYVEQTGIFFRILSELFRLNRPEGPEKAGPIAAYIRKHASRSIPLDELSQRFSYSKNQIINIMKSAYQMTPGEYQNHLRIQKAEWQMVATSKPLAQIASECGYSDYSQFYKTFSRAHGISPAEWRGIHRE